MTGGDLFRRYGSGPILTAKDWPYGVNSVFNAGATMVDGEVLLLVRVEGRNGCSHLTVARSKNGIDNWQIDSKPTFTSHPRRPLEAWNVEDPRIAWLEELKSWAVTYTAYSEQGPLVALALTRDFKKFRRVGPITFPPNKDGVLFPKRFNGKWLLISRPSADQENIWVSESPDLVHWGRHQVLMSVRKGPFWDSKKVGSCVPPLKTELGWLSMFHGVKDAGAKSLYRLGLILQDLKDPKKVLRRTPDWVMGPEVIYEQIGDVGGAIFPCGWVVIEDKIYLYYGVADTALGLATANFTEVLDFIWHCPPPKRNNQG